jgi:hypothetical protein
VPIDDSLPLLPSRRALLLLKHPASPEWAGVALKARPGVGSAGVPDLLAAAAARVGDLGRKLLVDFVQAVIEAWHDYPR